MRGVPGRDRAGPAQRDAGRLRRALAPPDQGGRRWGRGQRDGRPGRVRLGLGRPPGPRRRRPGGRDRGPGSVNPHLPAGVVPDLAEGGSLPGAWIRAWTADPSRVTLSTLDGERVSAEEL